MAEKSTEFNLKDGWME